MAMQLHRRDPLPVLGDEVDGLKPHRKRQLGGIEDGAGGDRGLAVAPIALLELAAGQLATFVVAAMRTWKSIRPTPPIEGIKALVFSSVEREKLVQADSFLKLHWVSRHACFLSLSLSYMNDIPC